jgi:hypothetical protein
MHPAMVMIHVWNISSTLHSILLTICLPCMTKQQTPSCSTEVIYWHEIFDCMMKVQAQLFVIFVKIQRRKGLLTRWPNTGHQLNWITVNGTLQASRVLVYWYSKLVVYVKWKTELSNAIVICKRTRQGVPSSPFLFNLLYQDMVDDISRITTGISINNVTYNIFCSLMICCHAPMHSHVCRN